MMINISDQCEIRIDKQGIWYFHDEEMKRQDIVRYLYQYLKRDSDGKYLIEMGNDRCFVTVEDVPYIINGVESCFSPDGQSCLEISLSDGSKEALNLDIPFWTGEDNALYCRVKKGEYAARFSRPAYYQLCEYIEHELENGTYIVAFGNSSHPLVLIDQP